MAKEREKKRKMSRKMKNKRKDAIINDKIEWVIRHDVALVKDYIYELFFYKGTLGY